MYNLRCIVIPKFLDFSRLLRYTVLRIMNGRRLAPGRVRGYININNIAVNACVQSVQGIYTNQRSIK